VFLWTCANLDRQQVTALFIFAHSEVRACHKRTTSAAELWTSRVPIGWKSAHLTDEPKASARNCPNEHMLFAGVADPPTRRIDPAGEMVVFYGRTEKRTALLPGNGSASPLLIQTRQQ
jgi:hypothetical protein